MPKSENSGLIKATIDDEMFYRIAAQSPEQSHRFGFITTGDNDRTSDCKHSPVNFSVDITYY